MNNFVPLHIISGYSFLKSGLTIKKISKALKENDYFAMGLTDNAVLYGLPEFAHMMEENKKPYVLGMNIAIEDYRLSLLVQNEVGYRNLLKILQIIQEEDVSFEKIKEFTIGLVGVLETNHGAFKEEFFKEEKVSTTFSKKIASISRLFNDSFYLGIEVTSKEEIKEAKQIRLFAEEHTYSTVAFPRIRYLKKDDAIVIKIVEAIDQGITLEEKNAIGQEYFMKESDYAKIYTKEEILNTKTIAESCHFNLFEKRGNLLHYPVSDSKEHLKELTFTALKNIQKDNDEFYINRLNYELDVINSMGYADYFLLVQDYVSWAKKEGILVGAGRGSAAGSLVSYLLDITEIDPLKYDLLFERFLNPDRKTMPDIDVDFMDTRREDVIQYLRSRFGEHHIATIGTFQTIQAKQALRDIARVYQYPERHIVLLTKLMNNRDYSLGQTYRNNEKFKEIVDSDNYFKEFVSLAGKIEGLPRQAGQHAAGIIINDSPLENSIPVTIDYNDNLISQYEASYLEEQGFLKMDLLALRNLTIVDNCLQLVNKNKHANLTIKDIPYEEKEIFELISSGQNIGLFQIETMTMQKGIKILKPSNFNDIVALLALNRPGPMPYLKNYALRRDGKEKFTYLSKDLEKILSSTYGIIVYQEQINQIAVSMAGFTPGEADLFRRAISKKDKDILLSMASKFISGAKNKGYLEKVAQDVFKQIETFAEYGFNKSHSVVYAVLTCRMAYLKYHYPLEFYASLLKSSASDTKFSEYISEMKQRGLKIYQPSINHSSKSFLLDEDGLLFPLSAISGIHDAFVDEILLERENGPFTDFFDLASRMYGKGISESNMEKLIDSGALDEFKVNRASLRANTRSALQYAEINHQNDDQLSIGIALLPKPNMNLVEDDPLENLDKEYVSLGIMLSDNPLRYKKDILEEKKVIPIHEAKQGTYVTVAGIIKNKKIIRNKKGQNMAFVRIFDEDDEIEVTLFSEVYDKAVAFLDKNSIIIVKGRINERNEEISLNANEIELLEENHNG